MRLHTLLASFHHHENNVCGQNSVSVRRRRTSAAVSENLDHVTDEGTFSEFSFLKIENEQSYSNL